MKIKAKIIIIISIFSLGLFVIGGIVMSIFFFHFVEDQEQQDFARKCNSVSSYLHNEVSALDSTLRDWAKWDDTYRFVQTMDSKYIERNLSKESIENIGISFMVFFDSDLQDVYHLYYNLSKGDYDTFPENIRKALQDDIDNSQAMQLFPDAAGIIEVGSRYYYLARTSITDSAEELDPYGVMVIGKEIDEDEVQRIYEVIGGRISFYHMDQLDAKIRSRIEQQPTNAGEVRSASIPADKMHMSSFIEYTNGDPYPGFAIEMTGTRSIYQSGIFQHNLMMAMFFVIMLVVLLMLYLTSDRYITKPLTNLIRTITSIKPDGSITERLEVKDASELSDLSKSINSMLDSIDKNYGELQYKEEQFKSLVSEMKQGLAVFELIADNSVSPLDSRIIYANDTFGQILECDLPAIIGKSASEACAGIWNGRAERLIDVAVSGGMQRFEAYLKASGKYIEITAYRPRVMEFATIVTDITEQKLIDREREYTSYHDQLTGLYNRRYFEEAMRLTDVPENLPVSVIIGDLNGLKFTNDAFGHDKGDVLLLEVANVLKSVCSEKDVIARWGGDEFTILLPRTSLNEVGAVCARIKQGVARIEINSLSYTISLGYETKTTAEESMNLLLKHAEDFMYRRKMQENLSGRGSAIQAIMTTFKEKNGREREHSNRVSQLCGIIGRAMHLPNEQICDLEIAGLVHDIGKIAISDEIINKTSRLTASEWMELKRHPEIGFRILCASNEMLDIAGMILAHHERWDGSGYPKGLAGEEISIHSRILAVADAYDAITSERPYKAKMDVSHAIAELRRCAGIQFDPAVVEAFAGKLEYDSSLVGSAMNVIETDWSVREIPLNSMTGSD